MIKANELRIGNHIQGGIINSISYKIGVKGNSSGKVFYIHESTLQPIPLTPEILEKCPQFKKWNNANTYEIGTPAGNIQVTGNEVWIGGIDSCTSGMGYVFQIDYLHKLQNLYFALTGKELEVNLNSPATTHNQN